MISFGNYRLEQMTTIFSPGNDDGHQNAEGGCPNEEHQHMTLVFVSLDSSTADRILALDHKAETGEWTVNKTVTFQLTAQAEAAHIGRTMSALFGQEIAVATMPGMPAVGTDNKEDEDKHPYPGMYL